MNSIDILKRDISLTEHISKRLGQNGKKDGDRLFFKSGNENTASLSVWIDNSKGYKDFSDRLGAGTIIDFEMHFQGIEMKESIKFLCDMYNIKDNKRELKKSPKHIDIFNNFEDYRFNKGNTIYQKFLSTRGISIDTMKAYKNELQNIVKEFGFCEGLALGKGEFRDCILFPCYDGNKKIIGVKIRRVDGEKIGSVKSKAIKGTQTGIIYNENDLGDDIYICEGETDYIILKMLGYTSVIGNLGGAGANAEKIQSVVKHAKKIICLYDNDEAGRKGAETLERIIGRPIRVIIWEKIDGKEKYDINDLFKMGYREEDFSNILNGSVLLKDKQVSVISDKSDIITEEKRIDFIMNYKNPVIFLRKSRKFYDFLTHSFCPAHEVPLILNIESKEVNKMFLNGDIPKFYDICYRDGEKKGYFNIFDKTTLTKASNNPTIHPDLKLFIENLGNNKPENYNWIHKAILYKYTHLNDEKVPAMIIHSQPGVGKGTFIEFLKTIFGKENTHEKLSGRSIISGFDTYLGNKMIVEIDELETKEMTQKEAQQLSNRIKSMVFAKTISVNPKGLQEYTTDNLAWFIITSNDIKPLNIEKGDRRYSIIEGGKPMDKLDPLLGGRLNDEIFPNKEIIGSYIAWLFQEFPEVVKEKRLFPLDNEDKKYIQNISQNPTEEFFSWFSDEYPNIWKITSKEKKYFVDMYRKDIGEDDKTYDYMYEKSFNKNLPRGVKYTNVSIRGKSPKGYLIESQKNDENGYFESDMYEEDILKITY